MVFLLNIWHSFWFLVGCAILWWNKTKKTMIENTCLILGKVTVLISLSMGSTFLFKITCESNSADWYINHTWFWIQPVPMYQAIRVVPLLLKETTGVSTGLKFTPPITSEMCKPLLQTCNPIACIIDLEWHSIYRYVSDIWTLHNLKS